MRCPVHLSIGQEAVSVGVCSHLDAKDHVSSTHRSHAHYLAQGGDLEAMIGELYGKANGCCGGRGGSMHLIDRSAGFLGAVPIVGSTLPIAVGAAWGAQSLGTGARAVVFFGEGATEEGVFSESLNLACLHRLPVVFVCEDNAFSVYTKLDERRGPDFSFPDFFRSFGADFYQGDGMDVEAVRDVMGSALERMTETQRPQVLYFKTWRYLEHCGPGNDDHLGYRTHAEISEWGERDPLVLLGHRIEKADPNFGAWRERLTAELGEEIEGAFAAATAAPFPRPERLVEHVLARR